MQSRPGGIFLALCALIVVTAVAFEGPGVAKRFGLVEKDPVLVFVLPGVENARRLRASIAPDRIVWQGVQGLALAGGRVLALNLDDAGDVIEIAGWVDRPIQIVRLQDARWEEGAELDGGSRKERLARLRSLVNKPTLNRVEQIFVLMAMNDGLEI
ncbi:MAG: hypothetical protein V3T64_12300 [Myxococcota bacterium]